MADALAGSAEHIPKSRRFGSVVIHRTWDNIKSSRRGQTDLGRMILDNLQPEKQLCLIFARGSLSPELADRANSVIHKGLDWDKVLDFSVKHRIFPLVLRHLQHFEAAPVPERIVRLFQALFRANSEKCDILATELARIVEGLTRAGVGVIPLRGPLLASLIWGDHRLWVGRDLDLLVHPTDLRRARDLLCDGGYRALWALEEDTRRRTLPGRSKPTVLLAKRPGKTTIFVDLQSVLFPRWIRGAQLERQLWEDARPGSVFGGPGLLLSPFWNFIVMSLHVYKHLFALLRWVSELHEMWHNPETPRDMILRKSQQIGLREQVLLSIAVCERVLGEDSKRDFCVDYGLVRRLSRNVFRPALSVLPAAIMRLQLPGNMIEKIGDFASILFAPPIVERHLLPLPRYLHFLHYLMRPMRLTLRYGLDQPLGLSPPHNTLSWLK